MDSLPNAGWTESVDITHAFWIYCAFFVMHELEEWNIAAFEKRFFEGLPAVHTARNARAFIGIAAVLAILWCAAASLAARPGVSAAIFLPAIVIAATNGLQHVIWSIRFRALASGLLTSVLLILPASACLVTLILSRALVPLWYVAALSGVASLTLVSTLKAGTRAPSFVPIVYGIADRVTRFCTKPRVLEERP